MQCLACGAEMQLREVVLADIPTMPGFERHTFRCSACAQVARRLVICRAKMPVVDPLVPPSAPEASASKLQSGRPAAGNPSPTAVEKLRSTQAAVEEAEAADWTPTVERLTKALKERAISPRFRILRAKSGPTYGSTMRRRFKGRCIQPQSARDDFHSKALRTSKALRRSKGHRCRSSSMGPCSPSLKGAPT